MERLLSVPSDPLLGTDSHQLDRPTNPFLKPSIKSPNWPKITED